MNKFIIAEAEKERILGMHYNAMGKTLVNEQSLLMEGVPNTTLKFDSPVNIASRSVCGSVDYVQGSVILQNTGTEDAYINLAPILRAPAGMKELSSSKEFNVTIGGKPVVGQADGQNQLKIPKGKKATLNFVIRTNGGAALADYQREMQAAKEVLSAKGRQEAETLARKRLDDRRNAFKNLKSTTLLVRYNGQPLEVPVNFGGFMVDSSRVCDAEIMLPKGF
jgi:hypothetical protein